MDSSLCMQPGVLRIVYIIKVLLNILRFVVPLGLIIKTVYEMYKGIINPSEKGILESIKSRVIAAIIVFFIPTIINLLMNVIESSVGNNSYNGFTECYDFANLDQIKIIEKNQELEELQTYLTEKEKLLDKYSQIKIAYKKMYESSKKIDTVGEYANNKNTLKCGSGPTYNKDLFNAVRSAGLRTREGATAAAIYLSSHINIHIPYYFGGGHFHSYSGFSDTGDEFMGLSKHWGCNVGGKLFGMDCSGFVAWALLNGGYYTGDSKQKITVSTNIDMSSIGGVKIDKVELSKAKGKVKPGDVLLKSGHVGFVIEVSDSKVKIAEEQNSEKGLIISDIKYSSSRFKYVILMDNFYNNYQKGNSIWTGFYQ